MKNWRIVCTSLIVIEMWPKYNLLVSERSDNNFGKRLQKRSYTSRSSEPQPFFSSKSFYFCWNSKTNFSFNKVREIRAIFRKFYAATVPWKFGRDWLRSIILLILLCNKIKSPSPPCYLIHRQQTFNISIFPFNSHYISCKISEDNVELQYLAWKWRRIKLF